MEDRSFRVNLAVGLFTIAVLAAVAGAIGFFASREAAAKIAEPHRIFVRFDDVAGLRNGAQVTLAGRWVGYVEGVRVAPPAPPAFPRGGWEVTLAVDPRWKSELRRDSTYAIVSESIFGNKYVNVTFGERGESLAYGTVIEGVVAGGLDARTLGKLSGALDDLSASAKELRLLLAEETPERDPTRGPNLRSILVNLETTLTNSAEASAVLKEALSEENQARMKQTFTDFETAGRNLAEVTARMKTGMDDWASTLEKMKFWKGWFGG